ncbi:arylalkylamine N-acetyltransferase-like 2 isoform X2 [Dreissena polymorpha]|uniref:arylalkylamine N-acetyltransferase-like 2 isoform X2 n=1 Tax=Dreissena polymorpha TaxID=45954 RepID=UPI002264DF82|nr:arylalkylamine N-acetyltransferase-like 2 isoform X2 [Dreissena polymorpha]XP_052286366.1 arylalkylamine N-acetyltransferase-like 2 isoform X2 [Dreissena polymorpha]XP_052286367.1 arylalkylamine N-acetyltransferase-like 2 isoform X2 [Dreissena polymorpha]
MNAVSHLTIERTQKALDTIRGRFDAESERLEIITPDRYNDAFAILKDHFIPDEPLGWAFGVKWHQEFQDVCKKALSDNCSLCMMSKENNAIMGVCLIEYKSSSDPPPNFDFMTYEELRELLKFVTHKSKEVDFFNRYGVDEALYFFMLGVHKKYQRIGLGSRLLEAGVALGKELGFKAIKVEATSNFSQRICQKLKFECILDMPYDDYTFRGKKLSESTGEHKMTKVLGLKL